MNEERLIEEVRKFPCLWDVSTKAYRDIKAKENAWKVVANEVNVASSIIPKILYFISQFFQRKHHIF